MSPPRVPGERGVPSTDFETLNVTAPSKAVAEAQRPVSVEEYPTAEDALARFALVENAYLLSAEVEDDGSTVVPETEQSRTNAIAILENFTGTKKAARDYHDAGAGDLRRLIASNLLATRSPGAVGGNDTGTWRGRWQVVKVMDDFGDRWLCDVWRSYETNFLDLDTPAAAYLPPAASVRVRSSITLVQREGNWYVDWVEADDRSLRVELPDRVEPDSGEGV